MVLFKNPITKTGELRYVEIIKVFIFVMFLFALYSVKIQNIPGFDTAFAISSSVIFIFICLAISIQLYTDCMVLYHKIVAAISQWLTNLQTTWKLPSITLILIIKQVIEYITTKQTQAEYCVYRC